jgi:hypothetical protein
MALRPRRRAEMVVQVDASSRLAPLAGGLPEGVKDAIWRQRRSAGCGDGRNEVTPMEGIHGRASVSQFF